MWWDKCDETNVIIIHKLDVQKNCILFGVYIECLQSYKLFHISEILYMSNIRHSAIYHFWLSNRIDQYSMTAEHWQVTLEYLPFVCKAA